MQKNEGNPLLKPIAIIPARGGSKRIPRKNIVDMNGKPMISYPIETAIKSNVFSAVFVSTEDSEIKEIAKQYGAQAMDRPKEMATDEAFETEAYQHALGHLETRPPFFCAIYATAIFITPEDLISSYEMIKKDEKTDCVMSASHYPIHPFKALKESAEGYMEMVYPKECLMRSQTYPEYVASNGTFYWCRTESYMKNATYYPKHLKTYILPNSRGVDIDTPEDLELARAMLTLQK